MQLTPSVPSQKTTQSLQFSRLLYRWAQPGWSFLFSLIVYFIIAFYQGKPWNVSNVPYFNYLADAFLHGQVYLRLLPSSLHDLVPYNGHIYLYWPPFPAIFLMPFVAIFGVSASDVLITIVIGALNVGLIAQLLKIVNQKGLFELSEGRRAALVAFFALGTVQLTLAPLGRVWFTSQEIAFLCVVLAYLATLTLTGWRAFALTGLALACAMATRNHLVFTGIWPAWYLLKTYWPVRWKKLIGYALAGVAPILIVGFLLIAYNLVRFGSPTEVGITYHNMSPFFQADYEKYGYFSLYYLPINFYYEYIYYPFPLSDKTLMGGSLFLLSPLFFAAFYGIWVHRKDWSTWMLIASIMVVNIPILLLMGTGWINFGPRYTFDYYVPLLLLTAGGIKDWKKNIIFLLVCISFIHYFVGVFILRIATLTS